MLEPAIKRTRTWLRSVQAGFSRGPKIKTGRARLSRKQRKELRETVIASTAIATFLLTLITVFGPFSLRETDQQLPNSIDEASTLTQSSDPRDSPMYVNLWSTRELAHAGEEIEFRLVVRNDSGERIEAVYFSGFFADLDFVEGTYNWTRNGVEEQANLLEKSWVESGHSMQAFDPQDEIRWQFRARIHPNSQPGAAASLTAEIGTIRQPDQTARAKASVKVVDDGESTKVSWCRTLSVDDSQPQPGAILNYVAKICNTGDVKLDNVQVHVSMGKDNDGVAFVPGSGYQVVDGRRSAFDCDLLGICRFGELEPGQTLEVHFQLKVLSDAEVGKTYETAAFFSARQYPGWHACAQKMLVGGDTASAKEDLLQAPVIVSGRGLKY